MGCRLGCRRIVDKVTRYDLMPFTDQEILETVRMIELETLDIRTITLGINLLDCADPDLESACEKVYAKIVHHAQGLVAVGDGIAKDYGIPIVNKRIATTPIALVAAASASSDLVPFARAMDAAAERCGVDFIGGGAPARARGVLPPRRVRGASPPRARVRRGRRR